MNQTGSNIYLVPLGDRTEEEVLRMPHHKYLQELAQVVSNEQAAQPDWMSCPDLKNQLFQLYDSLTSSSHTGNDLGVEITLDWAMQVRAATELPWAQCLQIASVFYYG